MFKRFRRLRSSAAMHDLTTQTRLSKDDLIYPLFAVFGEGVRNEIASMPNVFQLSIDELVKEARSAQSAGIKAIMLFGIPNVKDAIGSDALSDRGIIAEATKALKKAAPDLLVFTDLCFCEYTDHGHCGVLDKQGRVDNDATLENLAKQALIHAKAGSDCVCPSGMMDGMVGAIRAALDENGFENLPILSYSTKFASAYYGPFRDAAQSAPSFGDRRGYQMNPANAREAIAESLEDEAQGADMLMIKPALAYLDITRTLRDQTNLPIAVYNVSGEYAMLKAAQKLGLIDYDRALMETMIAFKRAGADMIITYHAKEVCDLLDRSGQ
ncbi:MAG: porphobilinogen synthase [Helicobacteraceae bacterium]|jgi:porphobilinogen synthase|nr:porphobilinogen synthase [Helicobacteraceae bacterium]